MVMEGVEEIEEAINSFILDIDASLGFTVEEAVLTTEQRKRLKPSDFCGPDRTYPVPDALHARVALVYLLKNLKKMSKSTALKIFRCIVRKAKKFGVNISKQTREKFKRLEESFEEEADNELFIEWLLESYSKK